MPEIQEYKCPRCGGSIEFDASSQKLKCPYCGTEFDVKTIQEYNEKLHDDKADDMKWEMPKDNEYSEEEGQNLHAYVCRSCGGEIIADENTAAASCPFCGSPVVITGNVSGSLKPDLIIPFKLKKKKAKESLEEYLTRYKFLPETFKDQKHIREVKGVYVPFWLFQSSAVAQISYRAEKVRVYSDSKYIYTENRYYLVHRGGDISFDNVPVDGSSQMPDDLMESVEPFDMSAAVDFQSAYLAGYLASRYDVSAEDSVERANERIRQSADDAFKDTVKGYISVLPESTNIQLHNGKTKYALYPVWILNTEWNGENYIFAMNGQTGKFVGNLPVDKAAAAKWIISRGIVFSIIAYGIIFLLHMLGVL